MGFFRAVFCPCLSDKKTNKKAVSTVTTSKTPASPASPPEYEEKPKLAKEKLGVTVEEFQLLEESVKQAEEEKLGITEEKPQPAADKDQWDRTMYCCKHCGKCYLAPSLPTDRDHLKYCGWYHPGESLVIASMMLVLGLTSN